MANDEEWRKKLADIDKRARKARVKRAPQPDTRRHRRPRAMKRELVRRFGWLVSSNTK